MYIRKAKQALRIIPCKNLYVYQKGKTSLENNTMQESLCIPERQNKPRE